MKIKAERSTGLGAGAIIYAEDTGRVLLLLRSDLCDDAQTWCCAGGGVENGETITQGLRRELMEEIGYRGPITLRPYYKCESPDFTYHNHVGSVEKEFEPVLNNEHDDYVWCDVDKLPSPLHPKFAESLNTPTYLTVMRSVCPVI